MTEMSKTLESVHIVKCANGATRTHEQSARYAMKEWIGVGALPQEKKDQSR